MLDLNDTRTQAALLDYLFQPSIAGFTLGGLLAVYILIRNQNLPSHTLKGATLTLIVSFLPLIFSTVGYFVFGDPGEVALFVCFVAYFASSILYFLAMIFTRNKKSAT